MSVYEEQRWGEGLCEVDKGLQLAGVGTADGGSGGRWGGAVCKFGHGFRREVAGGVGEVSIVRFRLGEREVWVGGEDRIGVLCVLLEGEEAISEVALAQ